MQPSSPVDPRFHHDTTPPPADDQPHTFYTPRQYPAPAASPTPAAPVLQPTQPGGVPPQPVAAPTTGDSTYNFIMEHPVVQPSGLKATSSSSRLLIGVIGIAVVLALLLGVGKAVLAPKTDTTSLVHLAEQQQELIRVATEAEPNIQDPDTANLAITTQLSLMTDQTTLTKLIGQLGQKIPKNALASLKNSTTDTDLTNAKANGSYDTTYQSLTEAQLAAYQTSLKQVYLSASSSVEKTDLGQLYSHAGLLITMGQESSD